MSLAARLNRLAPGLTAKQRDLLVIRTYVNQTEQDPQVRRTIPQDQRRGHVDEAMRLMGFREPE